MKWVGIILTSQILSQIDNVLHGTSEQTSRKMNKRQSSCFPTASACMINGSSTCSPGWSTRDSSEGPKDTRCGSVGLSELLDWMTSVVVVADERG